MKACTRCALVKPDTDFQVRKASKDGLTASCKECLRVYDRRRGFHGRREYAAEYRAKHPDRRKAHIALNNALRDGRITALPCLICGAEAQAHHTHYDAPLDVVWLCPVHHKQAHAIAA
jgi:hypothetical protein